MKNVNNEYRGELKGFPKEVVEKMLERQEEQVNPKKISIFEVDIKSVEAAGGFDWDNTVERYEFWRNVIENKDFDLFFKKYPKNDYPKVMWVSQSDEDCKGKKQRVVFMEKNGRYIAWHCAETFKDAEKTTVTSAWKYAKDIEPEPEIVELTFEGISKGEGVGIDPKRIRIKE